MKKPAAQPRIPGLRRVPTHAAVMPEIEAKVEQLAHRYAVSKSWVRATILAEFFNIDAPDFRRNVVYKRRKR